MIISCCPLRISLVGGGSDHPYFIEKYKRGSVISFTSNLKVYVTLHKDIAGINYTDKKFIINYSQREEVENINDIRNDIVRKVLQYFDIDYTLTISLTSDISSSGSGLASSSAYILALISALNFQNNWNLSEFEVCKIGFNIEKSINPLVGQQDLFGSLEGGLKRIDFSLDSDPSITILPPIFDNENIYLIHTGICRNSTNILHNINIDNSFALLEEVSNFEKYIKSDNINKIYSTINDAWKIKKTTSDLICGNESIKVLDNILSLNPNIFAHKLCGAGNGGYFLVFGDISSIQQQITNTIIPISITNTGISVKKI